MAAGIQRGALKATWAAIKQRQGIIASAFFGGVAYLFSTHFLDSGTTASTLFGLASAAVTWSLWTFVLESLVLEPRRQLRAAEAELAEGRDVVAAVNAAPVSDRHERELREKIEALKKKVRNWKVCDLDSSPLGHSFRSHFPNVAGSVDAWDGALPAIDEAIATFRRKLSGCVAADSGCDLPRADKTAEWISQWLLDEARKARPNGEFPFKWTRSSPEDGRPSEWSSVLVPLGGRTFVMNFARGPEGEVGERQKAQFERFFASVWTWPELQDVEDRREVVAVMRPELLEALARLGGRDHFTGECERCRRGTPDAPPQS